jgi:aminoglycoside phosphotransferase (APT) family kinase protein
MANALPPIDIENLRRWLDANVPQSGDGPVALERLSGGTSSSVYKLQRSGGVPVVLRLPAFPPRADSLKAMAREARVLQALKNTNVPHPQLLGYCGDDETIGAHFMLMSFVDGWMGSTPPAPFDQPGPERTSMAFAMVDAVAALAKVDYRAVGLADFGKPEGFLERQVDRWLAHMESLKVTENHPGRDIPGLDEVVAWLRANTPKTSRVGLIHSDIGFPNLMFARNEVPARVAAIVDWEIATLGDPLLDLGRAIFALPGRKVGTGKSRVADNSDLPTREELADYYAARTGFSVEHLDYYLVLSMFKLGAIVEFNYARLVNGRDSSGQAQLVSDYILDLFIEARDITRAAS